MKEQRSTHGLFLSWRSRWFKAAMLAAVFVILFLSAISGRVTKKAEPQPQSGNKQIQIQTPGQALPQTPIQTAAKTTPQLRKRATATAAPSTGGMMAFIDPATGQIREPEASEIQALTKVQKKSLKAAKSTGSVSALTTPAYIHHPSGAVGMAVGEEQMSYSVARINPDGTISTACLPGQRAANEWLKDPGRHTPAGKEKLDEK
jgi:hypothetical protein